MNIKGGIFVEGGTAITNVTRFTFRCDIFTIYGFCHDAGTGCFTHTTRSAKQKGLRQMVVLDSVFKGYHHLILPYHIIPGSGPVFPCRYYKTLHGLKITILPRLENHIVTKFLPEEKFNLQSNSIFHLILQSSPQYEFPVSPINFLFSSSEDQEKSFLCTTNLSFVINRTKFA